MMTKAIAAMKELQGLFNSQQLSFDIIIQDLDGIDKGVEASALKWRKAWIEKRIDKAVAKYQEVSFHNYRRLLFDNTLIGSTDKRDRGRIPEKRNCRGCLMVSPPQDTIWDQNHHREPNSDSVTGAKATKFRSKLKLLSWRNKYKLCMTGLLYGQSISNGNRRGRLIS